MADRTIYQRGCAAYHEELPHLLGEEDGLGKWVAFHGERLIGVHGDRAGVYALAAKQLGPINLDELFVSQIAPEQEPLEEEMFLYR